MHDFYYGKHVKNNSSYKETNLEKMRDRYEEELEVQ